MLKFDPLYNPYTSRRMAMYARRGMVATSQPLAAQAGLEILKKGGNAIDAAVATAACLTVVEPTANGIGGDSFALIWKEGKLYGLNNSGPAPAAISADKVKALGHKTMPKYGWLPVTVPGVPAGWVAALERFGRLTLEECLEPAIEYARSGYPVSPVLALNWQRAFDIYKANLRGEEFSAWFETFAPKGRAPRVGEIWNSPAMAQTLQLIAQSKGDDFYKGSLAKKIVAFARKYGGFLDHYDLESFRAEWVKPVSVNYKGYDVWEIPPNGQGMIALMALNILKDYSLDQEGKVDFYHKQIEALKLAFSDGLHYITDPRYMEAAVEDLLSTEYGQKRKTLIGEKALEPRPGSFDAGGTVYLATADGEGNMVSYIQSNYMGFGSGLVVPGTGISLQNRGHTFSLEEEHINYLEPQKKTYHTIIPGFLTKGAEALGPFGVMGGFMQPQGHLQVIINSVDKNMNPQAALDSPRWQWLEGKKIFVEPDFPNHVARALQRRGHQIEKQLDITSFGRGQIIWRTDEGVLVGASDPRTDGQVVGW